MVFGLYARNAACNTSAAFEISESSVLKEKFYSNLTFLEDSSLIEFKIIEFTNCILKSDVFDKKSNN